VFTITGEFRAPRGGVRRRVLATWRQGELIAVALDRASAKWNALSKEERPLKDLVGRFNSSLTRVKPIFNELLDTHSTSEWLRELWRMALAKRPGGPEPHFSTGPCWMGRSPMLAEQGLATATIRASAYRRSRIASSVTGTPLDGANVTRDFQRMLKAADLPVKRFHDLRHTAASLHSWGTPTFAQRSISART
jgi:hypothetical protein